MLPSLELHILTAVSRPENLAEIEASILAARRFGLSSDDIAWTWHRMGDLDRKHVGGQHLKNRMLADIASGWVCILDDDTVMHPKFLRKVYRAHRQHPDAQAIVVSQKRTTGVVLQARPENMVLGKVDAGQVVLKRSLIDTLIPEIYAGDGLWIESLLSGREDVHYMSDVLSLHNALSGVDVSETPERMGA